MTREKREDTILQSEASGEKSSGSLNVIEILSIVLVLMISDLLVGYLLSFFTNSIAGMCLFIAFTVKFLITILYATYLHRIKTGTFKGIVKISWRGLDPVMILWGLLLTVSANIVLEPVISLFPEKYMRILENAVGSGGWALITSIFAAPFFEELLFRGMIQEELSAKYGVFRGIIIAALIFGIVHIIPQQVVAAFVIGIILGYIYVKTQSIISVIVIHGANNALAQFSLILTDDITVTTRDLISSDNVYFGVYAVSSLFLIIFAVIFVKFCFGKRGINGTVPEI